jgi:hypothetical protein
MRKRAHEKINFKVSLLFLLGIFFVNVSFGQQENQIKPPLGFQQIELLIKAQTPDNVIAGEIIRRGISFEISKNLILILNQIGAGPKTIEAINNFRSWLNDAKEVIPENLKKIYQALNEGNPSKIKHLLADTLFSESTALDSICIPFRYKAHYIESIIERPDDEYITIVRVLYSPLNEQAKNITFKRIHDNFIMVRVGNYEEIKEFELWKEEAMAISLKLFYALKAGRWDVISKLRSSDKISFNPLLKSWGVGVDDMKYVNKTADIVSNKGIKVRAKLEIMSNQIGYYTEFDIFLEPISNEFKVVGWAVNSYRIGEFDPDIEEYTLNRFNKKYDLLDSGSTIPTSEKPNTPSEYVSDSASLITLADKFAIIDMIGELKKKTSVRLRVVTIATTKHEAIESYAINLFKEWGAIQKGEDSRVLILVALLDKKIRIELSTGMNKFLSDNTCKMIIDKEMTPYFSTRKYSQGILQGVSAVVAAITEKHSLTSSH